MPPKWLSGDQVLAQVLSDDNEDLNDSHYCNGNDFESESSSGSDSNDGDNNNSNAGVVPAGVSGGGGVEPG